jgi:hypothetical protein
MFLKLGDVVLPPPLPALVSLLVTAGLAELGWRLASRLRRGKPEPLDAAAGFIVTTAALAVVVHALALAQLSTVAVLRPLGWLLAGAGGLAIAVRGRALAAAARDAWASLRAAPRWEQAFALAAAAATLGLAAAALGPPTDADSLDYHLGVPMDWLRHGGAYARYDWLTSRLVGLAESLNLLGLAAGTDSLGASLQLGGLLAAIVAVGALAQDPRDRRVAWLLVACLPVAGFLVPNQKPQMLPSAATTVAIVLAVRRFESFDLADALLAFGCAAFAFASKISFLLTAGFAILVGLLAARKSGRLAAALGVCAAVVLVIWVPLLARSFVFFGDPISPFLERLRPQPDPAVLMFAQYLRNSGGEHTVGTFARLPLTLLGTTNAGALTVPLGLGTLAFLPALRATGRARILLWAALAATGACLVLGQLAPRFYLEPYLWAGAALAAAPWGRLKKVVAAAVLLQGALSAVVALYGGATLFPGALTSALREKVMTRAAAGYAEARWLDEVLPPDAALIEPGGRFFAFTPRPFAVATSVTFPLPAAETDARLARLFRDFHLNTLVTDRDHADDPFGRALDRCGSPSVAAASFPVATRNPFNRATYQARIYTLRGCF